ncbi:MAG: cytochrome c [Ginsengibacter sp.]
MKKLKIVTSMVVIAGLFTIGCSSKRDPGRIYMPDMAYSRAYEAYANNELAQKNINYVPSPVEGTLRRGDLFPYTLPNDSNGYKMSATIKNPLPPLNTEELAEAGRLYNIYCGICHGAKMDAQGPLGTGGKIPAIANLTLKQYVDMPEGTMFHAITYGKGNMGSYASQLSRKQRWEVIHYVKSVQNGSVAPAAADAPAADSTGDGENVDSTTN